MKNPQGKRLERLCCFESLTERKQRIWLEIIEKRKKREQAEIKLREISQKNIQESMDCE